MPLGKTSFGLTQRHWSIFSAVNDSPHREAFVSGRLVNGQLDSLQRLESREKLVLKSRHKAILHLRRKDELFLLVNADEQRIEAACSGMSPPITNSCSMFARSLIQAPDRSPGS